MRHLMLRANVEREVAVERHGEAWRMETGEGSHLVARLSSLRDGAGRLDVEGRVVPFHVWRERDVVHVWVDGRVWRFEQGGAKTRSRTAAGAAGSQVVSPMPGTIRRVEVAAGDRVTERQPVIVMESMKMEMTLTAPRAGTVAEVRCKAGDLVELGAALVTLSDE